MNGRPAQGFLESREGAPGTGPHPPPPPAAAAANGLFPPVCPVAAFCCSVLLQKLHMGVIRDEALYRVKKQQHAAGTLRPAER